jgi:hypothetical protein
MKLVVTEVLTNVGAINPGGLIGYIRNVIAGDVEEIGTDVEEIIWTGMKDGLAKEIKICVCLLCCSLVNSEWFNASFLRGH